MHRVRWCTTHSVLCLLIGACSFWIVTVHADCWYEEDRHEEGTQVATAEPCLNCTCNRGALLCYLRVCPKLPNPPPHGCILLHRYRTCCPELICAEFPGGGNGLESRAEPDDDLSILPDNSILSNACVMNGSVYGPGSAMHSSSLCEYCYCLGGKQICVKPKCLLPIEGCFPVYDPMNCCPIQYNCSSQHQHISTSTSTTTVEPKKSILKGGCLVDGIHHGEGEKVLGVGHSVCDNCYCMKGLVRCEPLSCAPPLLGCTPVIKPGQCCAASYNCSGTIQIQPEPNYGLFPIVSKEYAKLRKVNQNPPQNTDKVVTVFPSYVFAESLPPSTTKHRSPGTFGTTRHFTGASSNPSTTKPFYYASMNEKHDSSKHSTRNYVENEDSSPGVYYATTNYEFQNTNYKRVYSTTTKPVKPTEPAAYKTLNAITTTSDKEERTKSPDYFGFMDESLFSIFESLLGENIDSKTENETENTEFTDHITHTTEDVNVTDETTSVDLTSTITSTDNSTESETELYETSTESDSTTVPIPSTTTDFNSNNSYPITLKTVLNSTDCINDNSLELLETNRLALTTILPVDANEINKLADSRVTNFEDFLSTTSSEESTTEIDVTDAVDVISKVNTPSATLRDVPNIPNIRPGIEAILNITKPKVVDYDYDYNEPSLPPSLPNVRIIPFVAADALDAKKESPKDNIVYPQEKVTDTAFGYTNLFSPPIETEGGFVPKNPPILDSYYENVVTVPSITVAPKPINVDCVDQEGREVVHGQSVSSDSPCVTCTCFYGNIVCQKPACPLPGPGCRKSSVQDVTLCCPHYICEGEAPTVVLDRLDGTAISQDTISSADRIVTPDPFRDVIRTEPAPNLQSLIVDMMPFLARQTTTAMPPQFITENAPKIVHRNTTKVTNNTNTKPEDEFSLDKVLDLLFPDDKEKIETDNHKIQTTTTVLKTEAASPIVATTTAPSMYKKPSLAEDATENMEQKGVNSNRNSIEASGVGLLKLAGCNIYGRMYRVGKIISELSGPCLECKCTEIGVQCKALKC